MRIDVLTLFPDMVREPLQHSIVARATARGVADLRVHDLRDWTTDRRRTADDTPYGGGAGMVMTPQPLVAAIREIAGEGHVPPMRILLCPQGELLNQRLVAELASFPRLLLVCGHYEGVDERVRRGSIDREISIGDYVLSAGEVAAVAIVDAVIRLLPGALGSPESAIDESHADGLLEYPQYTRPPEFEGAAIPEVLRSGHHAQVEAWRRAQAIERTRERRPDLYAQWWVRDRIARAESPPPRASRRHRPPPTTRA